MVKKEDKTYAALLAVIFIAASIPVFCGYVMAGGMAGQWAAMLQELSRGRFTLFTDWGTAAEHGFSQLAVNSNLFCFLPALFLRWSGSVRWTWAALLLLIQAGSLGGAVLLYRRVCPGRAGSLCGILLYVTMPFRIYLCYDRADVSQAFFWMLLPFYLWSLLRVMDGGRRCLFVPVSMLLLAATGYASAALFPVIAGLTLLAGLAARSAFLPLTALGGCLLAVPGLGRYVTLLFGGGAGGALSAAPDVSYGSIMTKGYAVGELFSFFRWAEEKPGIGAGLFFVLFLLAWNVFVRERSLLQGRDVFFLAAGLLLIPCALRYFPWDLVQRVHPVLLRMVSLLGTPGLFLHLACLFLTFPCAKAMGRLYGEGDRNQGTFLVAALLAICLATTVYQCNTYVFSRPPLPL